MDWFLYDSENLKQFSSKSSIIDIWQGRKYIFENINMAAKQLEPLSARR